MKKMKVNAAIRKAVTEGNARLAGVVVDHLRFRFGMKAAGVYRLANRLTDVTEARWDELLREADEEEGQG